MSRNVRKRTFGHMRQVESDQLAHSRSLIRIFTRRVLDIKDTKFLHADNDDWLDCADAHADLSLR